MGRSRRIAAVVAAAVAWGSPIAAWGRATPPSPDTSTPVYGGLPAGWTFAWTAMGSPEFGPGGSASTVEGDAAPGWGTGSLALHLQPVTEDALTFDQTLAGLTAASVWVRSAQVSAPPSRFEFSVEVAGQQWYGALPTTASWTEVDLGHLGLAPVRDAAPTTTLLGLAAAHPTTAGLALRVQNVNDSGGTDAFVDGWSITRNGATHELDLEAARSATVCELTAATATVTAGSSVTLTGSVRDSAAVLLGDRPVVLWSRPYGAPAYTKASLSTTSAQGHATIGVTPLRHTTYQLSHDQDATWGRCLSASVRVEVRSKVTLAISDTTVRKGRRLVVTGAVTPARSGLKVSLWRGPRYGQLRIEATHTAADGSYRMVVRADRRGTWRLQTSVPERADVLPGESGVRFVRVS